MLRSQSPSWSSWSSAQVERCSVADFCGQGLKASHFAPGDIFAGRRVCFHTSTSGSLSNVPALQRLGDCCRRLLVSHGVDVQVSVCMRSFVGPLFSSRSCPTVVQCLAPHLCGMSIRKGSGNGFNLQHLLPAAAQLEQVTPIHSSLNDLSLLGQFHMLKVLHVSVQHSLELTAPLPQFHTLSLRFYDTPLREANLQCLLPQAPALRQLVVEGYHTEFVPGWRQGHFALGRGDVEALVGLQCQQLDLLTVSTNAIDEHTVNLLARIQCPLKLGINIKAWSRLKSAPLLTMLARLPNLVALRLISLPHASNALWDQRGACLPDVQRLEMINLPLHMNDSLVPLLSIFEHVSGADAPHPAQLPTCRGG